MSFRRSTWPEIRVGDRVSLFCGVPVSVHEVIAPPPKMQIQRGKSNVFPPDTIWFHKPRGVWVVTLRGPRFPYLVVGDVHVEWDLLLDQPLWLEPK